MSAQSFDDHKIAVTFFPSHTAKTKTSKSLTLPELGDKILQMTKPGKKRLPWLKLAVFGDARTEAGALRHDDNVLSITGVEVDYDTCRITFDEAVERLWAAGVRALVYTSRATRRASRRSGECCARRRSHCRPSAGTNWWRRCMACSGRASTRCRSPCRSRTTTAASTAIQTTGSRRWTATSSTCGWICCRRPSGGRRLSSAKHCQQIGIYCKQMPARPTRTRRSTGCSTGRNTGTATARATGTPTCWR